MGILALFCAFYVWTAASSIPVRFTSGADGIHGQIADAFLHGRLSLADAPPELTTLGNPYDPNENLSFRIPQQGGQGVHDLSLYDGKLYAYWGPVPALVLFAPARLVGLAFSESLAVAVFAFLALAFGVLALLTLQRRFAPRAAAWKVNLAIVGLGLGNVLPYVLRLVSGPAQYQVTIAAGACFAMLATWLLLSGLLRDDAQHRPDVRRLAWASLALGLAVGTRPSHVITAAGLLALAGWRLRGVAAPRRPRVALALLGPVAACGVLLALYNVARFGSPTEFGLSYQLATVDVTARDSFSLSYLLPGLWYYLVVPLRAMVTFPFLRLAPPLYYPGHAPADYDGVEPVAGVFVLAPLALVLLVVPFRRRLDGELRAVLLTLLGISAGLVFVASIAFWGTTMRYEVDFAAPLLLGALTVWLRAGRRWMVVAGAVAIAWTSVVGLALSVGGGHWALSATHPKLWAALNHDFSPISRLAARVAYDGPAIGEVTGPFLTDQTSLHYARLSDQNLNIRVSTKLIKLAVVVPSEGVTHLRARAVLLDPSVPVSVLVAGGGERRRVSLSRPQQRLDVPLRLDPGVHLVALQARPAVPGPDAPILELNGLRVDDGPGAEGQG